MPGSVWCRGMTRVFLCRSRGGEMLMSSKGIWIYMTNEGRYGTDLVRVGTVQLRAIPRTHCVPAGDELRARELQCAGA